MTTTAPATERAALLHAKVVALDTYRARRASSLAPSEQGHRELAWDTLLALSERLWCLRDPETVAELIQLLAALGTYAAEDWGEEALHPPLHPTG